jgi:hypothetical protein
MPKNRFGSQPEPAQPLLPTINFAKLLCNVCPREICRIGSKCNEGFGADAEAGELSPRAVPPNSNTGVHHATSPRGASEEIPFE